MDENAEAARQIGDNVGEAREIDNTGNESIKQESICVDPDLLSSAMKEIDEALGNILAE
jgi:hypothetical protein